MARRNGKMKYWGFYASEELKDETIGFAKSINESDSEYIRKAIEQRNEQYEPIENIKKKLEERIANMTEEEKQINEEIKEQFGTHKNNTSKLDKVLSAPQKHPKPNMVKSFMKGDK